MIPSSTVSRAAGMLPLAAAADTSSARASAAATRNASPPYSTDWLPEVCPSSGVRAVSAPTMAIRPNDTSITSATICDSAVRMPWPSSALPVNTVMVPGGSTRIQPSSSGCLTMSAGKSAASAARSVKLATMPPNKARRESCTALTSRSPPVGRPPL